VQEADKRLAGQVRETPLVESLALSSQVGGDVWLKLENLQHTGSFKFRGALHRIMRLTEAERHSGVVAASSGNHGAAVALACQRIGVRCTVYVPGHASSVKIDAMQGTGAVVELHGIDGVDTEVHARQVAEQSGRPYLSPYNDWDVIAGQGTVAAELRRQSGGERFDVVVVAVGGGGLIGGIAADLKAHWPGVRVIGALPSRSPVMAESIRQGRIVEIESGATLSDGTAGGIEPGAVTFELCRALVDEWVLVDEGEIAAAMRHALTVEHLLIEGAAGVAIAGALRLSTTLQQRRVAIVLCGGNVSLQTLRWVTENE
jgi:threonine dehydratase